MDNNNRSIIQNQMFSMQFLENMPDGFSVIDTDGRQIAVNKAFCSMTGFSDEELLEKMPPYPYWPVEELDKINQAFNQTLNKEFRSFELIFNKKDGERFPVLISTSALKDENGNILYYFANVKDITTQKDAERHLKESEKRLTSIFENSPAFIFEVDSEFRYTFLNKIQPGLKLEDIIGQNVFKFIPEEFKDSYLDLFTRAINTGEAQTGEIPGLGANNEVAWYSVVLKPFFENETLTGFIGISTDISERKRTEFTLQESEKKFRELFENLIDEVHLWKVLKDQDGKIIGWELIDANPSALKAWGKSIDQVIGKTANEIFGTDAHSQFMPIVETIFNTAKPYKWEQYFPPTNQYLSMESIPYGEQFISTGKDITEQKKILLALQESELRLSVAIDGTEAGIWDWDLINNNVVFSTQWKAMFGYEDNELENSFETWRNLWHPDDASLIEKTISEHLNGVSSKYEVVHRCRHKDGSWRWIMTRGKILRDDNGKPYRWVGTNVDITVQKQAEEDQKMARKQSELANRAKSEFLANMSHEIRTPLNGVIGFSEMLSQTSMNNTQMQYLQSIQFSASTLLSLVNDILDYSKIEAGKMELFIEATDLRELVSQIKNMMNLKAKEKNLDFTVNVDSNVPQLVSLDPVRVRQILINLIANAIKFTEKGIVVVNIKVKEFNDNLNKQSILFSVQDTGIGINPEKRQKIFEAFTQADNSTTRNFGGTGLGLTISNKLLALMGSRLDVESELGIGSRFYFTLKLPIKSSQKIVSNSSIVNKKFSIPLITASSKKDIKILIVDDSAINRLIANRMVSHLIENVKIIEAVDGKEAIDLYLKENPDIILMDIQMPEKSGYEATGEIRRMELSENHHHVPIIAVTAGTLVGEKERCLDAGMDEYLSKPIDLKRLRNLLEAYLT